MTKSKVRASILVHEWFSGDGKGGLDGEYTSILSLPLARIDCVKPYASDIWECFQQNTTKRGAVRARIVKVDGSSIEVTETVEEVDALMNTPMQSPE